IVDARYRRHHLSEEWIKEYPHQIDDRLKKILDNYKEKINSGLYTVVLEPMRIDTGNTLPIFRKPYKLSPKEQQQIDDHVKDLLEKGIVRKSQSSWCAPAL